MDNTESSGWDSSWMRVLRYIFYIPVGVIFLKVVELLCMLFLIWLYRDMRTFVMVSILFGGLLIAFMAMYLFYSAIGAVEYRCPSKRTGMVVFTTIYILVEVSNLLGFLNMDESSGRKVMLAITEACCSAILVVRTISLR